MSKKPVPVSDAEKATMKKYYQLGWSAAETIHIVKRPIGLVKWYWQQFSQSGVSRSSDIMQELIQEQGTLGINYQHKELSDGTTVI